MRIFSEEEFKKLLLKDIPQSAGVYLCLIETKTSMKDQLRELIGCPDAEIVLNENGKPRFRNTPWRFNLSHSGSFTVIAFSETHELGIDLETWKSKERMLPITERYFHPHELKKLKAINDQLTWETEALRMWTCKEALIKLRGETLFQGLSAINSLKELPAFRFELPEQLVLTLMTSKIP